MGAPIGAPVIVEGGAARSVIVVDGTAPIVTPDDAAPDAETSVVAGRCIAFVVAGGAERDSMGTAAGGRIEGGAVVRVRSTIGAGVVVVHAATAKAMAAIANRETNRGRSRDVEFCAIARREIASSIVELLIIPALT
jgi:hypothetical protein